RVRAPISTTRPASSWRITTRLASHARRRDVSYETGSASGRFLREEDLVAELFEATDVVAKGPLRVALREVIGPEVVVRHAAREHVPQGHEHGVLDGDDGLLGAAPRFEAVVERPVVTLLR